MKVTCPDCGGCGEEIRDLSYGETLSVGPCSTCGGEGMVEQVGGGQGE